MRQEYAGAIATLALAQDGRLLHAPDIYMDKIAVGPGYPKNVVNLDAPADENIVNLAKAKGVKPEAITAMILDRPRHADLIGAVRKAGAAVSLITDGDVAGVIHTACAASAVRCRPGLCSIPRKSTSAPPKWASRIRAANTRSRTWSKASAYSLQPASLHAARRAVWQRRHRDRHGGHALGQRNHPLDLGRASASGQVQITREARPS